MGSLFEEVGHGKGDLGGEAEGVVIAIEGRDDVGVADGDGGEGLGAVDDHGVALVVGAGLVGAAALGGRDGEAGAAHVGEHVAEGLIGPLEGHVEVDARAPGDRQRVHAGDRAIGGVAVLRGLVLRAGDACRKCGHCQQQAQSNLAQHLLIDLLQASISIIPFLLRLTTVAREQINGPDLDKRPRVSFAIQLAKTGDVRNSGQISISRGRHKNQA